ncbi:MAG: DUF4381 domain-containing protein [Mariprofundus sp.]
MNPVTQTDPLAELRDIHLPDPVSWWPPAPGWWLLLLCLIALIAVAIWWWRRRSLYKPEQSTVVYSRSQILAQARLELTEIEAAGGKGNSAVLAELSALLRRVAVGLADAESKATVAGLSGEPWLQWLDGQWNQELFCHGDGRLLLDAPYRADSEVDSAALCSLIRAWLEALDKS